MDRCNGDGANDAHKIETTQIHTHIYIYVREISQEYNATKVSRAACTTLYTWSLAIGEWNPKASYDELDRPNYRRRKTYIEYIH
jgi:hypothetical protein